MDTPTVLLFGAPELREGAARPFTAERSFQLLSVLAVRSGEWVPRDHLAALLWPEHDPAEARRNLRKVLFKAGQVAGAQTVETLPHALRWVVTSDLQAFSAALKAGRFAAAREIRRGELLAGMDDPGNAAWTEWLSSERQRWQYAWHQAALDELRQLAMPEARIAAAEALLQLDALDEVAVGLLIDAQLRAGHVAQARRSYNAYAERLVNELGLEPARTLRDRINAAPAVTSGGANRPVPTADAFIGRSRERSEISLMLARSECRMLTILGPGGIGKSSLARRTFADANAVFEGGALWVELQDLNDVGALVGRLSQALGAQLDERRDPVDQLARQFDGGRWLLALDNAEHLNELPPFLDRLLDSAARLTLLITSRVRIRSAHEWPLLLAGLPVPDEDSRDLEAASSFDAVRLFDARARQSQRDFSLARHIDAVVSITEAVLGMPLAIELAAAWVRLLPPDEIARELSGSIALLERDPALLGDPARPEHRSMQAVLDRSWSLLTELERQSLAALSVFQGGFSHRAARQVAAVSLPLLSSLTDKSLLGSGEGGRFVLHPLIAAYAARQLEAVADRLAAIRERHAEHFAMHLAALAPHAIGDQRLLVAGVNAEMANCRAAWSYALERHRADLVYAMVRALWSYFENRGRVNEGIAMIGPALELSGDGAAHQRAMARLHHGLSMLHHRSGRNQEALELACTGVAGAEHCGDTEAYVGCVLNAGMCHWSLGRVKEGQAWFERGLSIAQERADRHCIAWSLGNLGVTCTFLGDRARALQCLTQALSGSRELGDQYSVVVHLNNLGMLMCDARDWTAALEYIDEGLRHCTTYGIDSLRLYLLLRRGHIRRQVGQLDNARVDLEEARRGASDRGLLHLRVSAEADLALLALAQGSPDEAIRRLREVTPAVQAAPPSRVKFVIAVAYGSVKAAWGDSAGAQQIWRTVIDEGQGFGLDLKAVEAKIAALPRTTADSAMPPAMTLDEVLQQLQNESVSSTR